MRSSVSCCTDSMYFEAVFRVLPCRKIQNDFSCDAVRKPFENVDKCVSLIVTLGFLWSHVGGKGMTVSMRLSVVEGDGVDSLSVLTDCDGGIIFYLYWCYEETVIWHH